MPCAFRLKSGACRLRAWVQDLYMSNTDRRACLGKIASWHNSGWLVVDAALEACWAPVDKLDGPARRYG